MVSKTREPLTYNLYIITYILTVGNLSLSLVGSEYLKKKERICPEIRYCVING